MAVEKQSTALAVWDAHRSFSGVLRSEALVELGVAAPVTSALVLVYGAAPGLRFLAGLSMALLAQGLFLRAMRRRIGVEHPTPADVLTLLRAATGGVLAGLMLASIRDRMGLAGWLACIAALLAATIYDWLDGPLARRFGPTRLGGVLDIEADSWLTLWCAVSAVAWGGLPWWCLLPPLARYVLPVRTLLRGELPAGGGPWWWRVTGVAQMALLLAALVPLQAHWRDVALAAAAPISGAQMVAVVVMALVPAAKAHEPLAGPLGSEDGGHVVELGGVDVRGLDGQHEPPDGHSQRGGDAPLDVG